MHLRFFRVAGWDSDKWVTKMFRDSSFVVCRSLLLTAAMLVVLSGCGEKKEQASAPAGQVVARVGDQVLTVQELETEFRWANIPADKRKDPEIVKRVLGDLVTRKYLLNQAMAAKLDREPTVLLDLLRARDQVLANAFSNRQLAARSSSVTKADVDKFIANNPAKFANQELISVEQVSVALDPATQSILEAMKSLGSLDEVDQKLTGMGIPHGRSTGVLNSAEIPDDLLKSIRARKPNDIFFARAGQNGVFLKIIGTEPHPVSGEAAAMLARQLLRTEMLKTDASMVGITARMEARYEGEYAKIMTDLPAKPLGN